MKVRDENFNHQPSSSKSDDIKIKINVDTSELDAAIEKAKELIQLTEQADKLLCKEVRN